MRHGVLYRRFATLRRWAAVGRAIQYSRHFKGRGRRLQRAGREISLYRQIPWRRYSIFSMEIGNGEIRRIDIASGKMDKSTGSGGRKIRASTADIVNASTLARSRILTYLILMWGGVKTNDQFREAPDWIRISSICHLHRDI